MPVPQIEVVEITNKAMTLIRNRCKEIATAGLLLGVFTLCMIGAIPMFNAVLFIPFTVLLYFLSNVNTARRLWLASFLIPTVLLGFFIAVFRPDGFDYPLVWSTSALYEGGKEFSLYANLSKAIGGYLVLVWLLDRFGNKHSIFVLGAPERKTIWLIALGIFSVLFVVLLFFGVKWQPKISEGLIYFVLINLLITVVSEEVFFRLLLYNNIVAFFSTKKTGVIWGVVITTLLFTLSHTVAFGSVFFLYLFAGFIYTFVYAYTKSLIASISVHFGVNICHFIFLEYPL